MSWNYFCFKKNQLYRMFLKVSELCDVLLYLFIWYIFPQKLLLMRVSFSILVFILNYHILSSVHTYNSLFSHF